MNRIVRVALIFAIIEVVFSVLSGVLARHVPQLNRKLTWVDAAIYVVFGVLLMSRFTSRLPLIIVAAAAVAVVDCSIGGTLGYSLGPPLQTKVPYALLFTVNFMVYPVKSVLWSLLGAAIAWPFRRVDHQSVEV